MRKTLICGMAPVLILAVSTAWASSPEEWEKLQREERAACIQASGLKGARTVGEPLIFGDDVGFDALLVRGRYPQPHMRNAEGRALCLFDRRNRKASCGEIGGWFDDPGNKGGK